jgi:hypothetical protein
MQFLMRKRLFSFLNAAAMGLVISYMSTYIVQSHAQTQNNNPMTDQEKLKRLEEIIIKLGTAEDDPRVKELIDRYKGVALEIVRKKMAYYMKKAELEALSEEQLIQYLRDNGIEFPDFDITGDMFTQVKNELEKAMSKFDRELNNLKREAKSLKL